MNTPTNCCTSSTLILAPLSFVNKMIIELLIIFSNISVVPTWEKINEGMFKMYEGEVNLNTSLLM